MMVMMTDKIEQSAYDLLNPLEPKLNAWCHMQMTRNQKCRIKFFSCMLL